MIDEFGGSGFDSLGGATGVPGIAGDCKAMVGAAPEDLRDSAHFELVEVCPKLAFVAFLTFFMSLYRSRASRQVGVEAGVDCAIAEKGS
jgi:hypothetical protein